jgi:hypothetical protein
MLIAIGLTPGGSSTVHIYTQTIHITTQRLWLEGFRGFEPRVVILMWKSAGRAPSLRVIYPGICLTTEEEARKNLSHGSGRVPVGRMKIEYTEQSIHNNKNTYLTKLNKSVQNV